jgi:hypothetical protein
MTSRPWWLRLLVSLTAGAAFATLVALVLTVIDLYLSGHGLRLLSAPLLDWSGVHLSLADLLFLTAAVAGAWLTWRGMQSAQAKRR